jgi:hypothetical protein
MQSGRRAKARTANEVAGLFLVQKLAQEKKRVRTLQRGASAKAASISATQAHGCFPTVISGAQGAWLAKMMKRDRQSARIVSFEGRTVGTWKYLGAGQTDPFHRLEFILDAAFMQTFIQGNQVEPPREHAAKKIPAIGLVAQLALPL